MPSQTSLIRHQANPMTYRASLMTYTRPAWFSFGGVTRQGFPPLLREKSAHGARTPWTWWICSSKTLRWPVGLVPAILFCSPKARPKCIRQVRLFDFSFFKIKKCQLLVHVCKFIITFRFGCRVLCVACCTLRVVCVHTLKLQIGSRHKFVCNAAHIQFTWSEQRV